MAPSPAAENSRLPQLQALQLLDVCPVLGKATRLCVAFSGGLDSTVLLHLLVQLRDAGCLAGELRALHIHHGLQASASNWAQHCRQVCERWKVSCSVVEVKVVLDNGDSPEAAARTARYAAFAAHLHSGELLVQAHHQDDQAETLLLRMLRGSSVHGLSGMPAERELGQGAIARPLLQVSRSSLQRYAVEQGLNWVEDPSNADSRFDRNYLRHAVLPVLNERWPGASASLARSAALEQEASTLLDDLARADWQQVATDFPNRLRLAPLRVSSVARMRNLLGYWLLHQPEPLHVGKAPLYHLLERCIDELVLPQDAAYRTLAWGEGERQRCLHRYRGVLYLLKPLTSQVTDVEWESAHPLTLPEPLGSLIWQGDDAQCRGVRLSVRFRRGGEVLPMSSGQHKTLKNFLQERGIPPWLRDLVPLVYHNETLLAVGDILLRVKDPAIEASKHNPLCWKRSELLCGY